MNARNRDSPERKENALIQVENVTKKYGQRVAVDRLNFTVNRGEILGFLGPNGAGKSTTMNIITGYLSATEGSVKLDGHDILEEPQAVKKQIGYMPELPPLYLDMTVRDYLSFVCDIKGVPRIAPQGKHGPVHGDAEDHRRRAAGSSRTSPRATSSASASRRPSSAPRRC